LFQPSTQVLVCCSALLHGSVMWTVWKAEVWLRIDVRPVNKRMGMF